MAIKQQNTVNIKNKRATFDFEILYTYNAGIVLTGTEIKSIRAGKASLVDTYCISEGNGLWVKNMYVAEYTFGSYNNHSVRRDRKLLLNKKEIQSLKKYEKEPGYSIVPLKIFLSDKGYAKMVIGIGRGKKEFDKRQSIREREDKRTMDRMFKK